MGRRKLVLPDTPSVVRKIYETYVRSREVEPLKEDGYVRASSLPNLCPREEVLAARLEISRKDDINADLNLTFAQGTGMHWVMQNQILPMLGDLLVGKWQCRICGHVVGGLDTPEGNVPMPESCEECDEGENAAVFEDGEFPFEFVEQLFVNEELRLTGHNDGFLRMEDADGDGVFELKSISAFRAKRIKDVPDMGHVAQAQSYMLLTKKKWAIILYWDKGTFAGPLTEHFVERDEDAIEEIEGML
jgi:hypothetical protein